MDYNTVIKFVNSRFGRCYSNVAYYNSISYWLEWYMHGDEKFHRIVTSNGINCPIRDMYGLKMAKRVAEDWASAVAADPPQITINNEKASIFVQGSKNNTGVLGSNNFNVIFSLMLEQMFALGTGAHITTIDGVRVSDNGEIVDVSNGRIGETTCNATCIIPISAENGRIVECAFVARKMYKGSQYTILSCHVKEDDEYVIYNFVLNANGNLSSLTFGLAPIMRTHLREPLFTIFRPNIANNIDIDSPMGISVYANAIDNLKAIDQVFDAGPRDVTTGQRIVLMSQKLLTRNEKGDPVPPQDYKQSFFQFFGAEATSDVKEFIKEFTPELRTDDLNDALQNQLNLLSFKCGLGTRYYNFSQSGNITAAEFTGERQDFVRNVKKMNINIASGIESIVRQILTIGNQILRNGVDSSAKIDVTLPDGIVVDDTKERAQDMKDVEQGIMSKAEYRMKWYGETLEEANKKLSLIQPVSTI